MESGLYSVQQQLEGEKYIFPDDISNFCNWFVIVFKKKCTTLILGIFCTENCLICI